jgi:hypothetical protein
MALANPTSWCVPPELWMESLDVLKLDDMTATFVCLTLRYTPKNAMFYDNHEVLDVGVPLFQASPMGFQHVFLLQGDEN